MFFSGSNSILKWTKKFYDFQVYCTVVESEFVLRFVIRITCRVNFMYKLYIIRLIIIVFLFKYFSKFVAHIWFFNYVKVKKNVFKELFAFWIIIMNGSLKMVIENYKCKWYSYTLSLSKMAKKVLTVHMTGACLT